MISIYVIFIHEIHVFDKGILIQFHVCEKFILMTIIERLHTVYTIIASFPRLFQSYCYSNVAEGS